MGAGIAAACLLAGLAVTMVERDAKSAAAGKERTLAATVTNITPINAQS